MSVNTQDELKEEVNWMSNDFPFLLITMGDAAGIGPEIVLMSLEKAYPKSCRPLIVGSFRIFEQASKVINSSLVLNRVETPTEGNYNPGIANVIDTVDPDLKDVTFGKISAATGKGSVKAIRKAHEISLKHPVKAFVSAPLNKQSIREAGFSYIDEIELLSELTGVSDPMMLLVSDKMRMATVSPLHVSMKNACENISAERIFNALNILRDSLISFGIEKPIIGVAALNPHGGEGGQLGTEELTAIIPGIEIAQNKGWNIKGPFPPDSFFFRASRGEFDAVLTMYHDQGRIALKTSDFGRITIVMIGVPTPFVTVAHGTAFGKAGKGTADPGNFIHAMEFAAAIKHSHK